MSARQILRSPEYLILVRTSVITSLTADESSALVVSFSYRGGGAGKVRRRIRRRARARAFTNARTATRSFELPPDIDHPPYLFPRPASSSSVYGWIPASARRPQRRAFIRPLSVPAQRPLSHSRGYHREPPWTLDENARGGPRKACQSGFKDQR
jgi:hypothetical protein